jgi:uncharacterized protein YjbI with pentapeptide repeats
VTVEALQGREADGNVVSDNLSAPTDNMTPEEKGILLLRHIRAREPAYPALSAARPTWSPTPFEVRGFWGGVLRSADLRSADLFKADLQSVDLSECFLSRACLQRANLAWANLSRTALRGADLLNAVLHKSVLVGADLEDASLCWATIAWTNLVGASLRGANLSGAELRDADLTDADLTGANVQGQKVDLRTYRNSRWTPEVLEELHRRGAEVVALDAFPDDVRAAILGEQDGLTLYFSTRLSFFDRFLVEGVVFAVLGRDTTCRVVEFKEVGDDGALVRLAGAPQADLEAVAEALWNRVWDIEEQSQLRALAVATEGLRVDLRAGLDDLVARLERMEVRLPSDEVIEMQDDQGAKYVKEKFERLLETGVQKAARLIRTWGTKKVLGEIDGEVTDLVKDGLGLGTKE